MVDTLLNLIKTVGGVDNFIRLCWAGTFLIFATSSYFFARSVYANARRGNPAQETLNQIVTRQQEEIAAATAERRQKDVRFEELVRRNSALLRKLAGHRYEILRLKEELRFQGESTHE